MVDRALDAAPNDPCLAFDALADNACSLSDSYTASGSGKFTVTTPG